MRFIPMTHRFLKGSSCIGRCRTTTTRNTRTSTCGLQWRSSTAPSTYGMGCMFDVTREVDTRWGGVVCSPPPTAPLHERGTKQPHQRPLARSRSHSTLWNVWLTCVRHSDDVIIIKVETALTYQTETKAGKHTASDRPTPSSSPPLHFDCFGLTRGR